MAWYNASYLYRKKITISASDVPITYTTTIFTGGSASASSTNGGDVAASAFDINTGTWWTSNTAGPLPVQLKYNLGVGITKTAIKFEITPRVADTNAKLVNFTFEGSNNDSDWDVLRTVTGETWADNTPKSYTFTNTTAYRYYRLNISSTVGGNYAQVVELKAFEAVSPALSDFDSDVFLNTGNFDFTKALSTGNDVVFTDADEVTLLKFERRIHDNVNEIAHYKVKIPEISSSVDTDFYLYYGHSGASDLSDPTNVYDSNFKAVLSLDQSGNGTSGEFLDSTSNNHDGRGGNGTTSAVPTRVTGKIYKAQDFDGGDYVSLPDSADWDWGTSNFTFSFQVFFDSTDGNQCFLGRPTSGGSYLYLAKEGGSIRFRDFSGGPDMSAGWSPSVSTWYRMFVTRNGSDFKIYANNTLILSASTATSFIARDVPLQIGANSAISYFVNGLMDEVKISVGIDRGDTYRIIELLSETDDLLGFAGEETNPNDLVFNLNETIVWNEAESENITIQLDEEIIWNEENQSLENLFFSVDEEIEWNETTNEILYSSESFQVDESVVWNETLSEGISAQYDETVVWNETHDEVTPQGTATFGSKIISINPLVFVSYSSPAKVTKVDVTDPENITWEAITITGLDYANGVIYNSTNGYLYISGASGKIAKIELNDLSNQTIINLSDSDNTEFIEVNAENLLTYITTDSSTEEIYLIDEREMVVIDTDFKYLQQNETIIDTQFDFIEAQIIDTDFNYLQTNNTLIDTNFCWLEDTVNEVVPIGLEDWHVYIDDVELSVADLKLDSINVTHTIDSKSTASFQLNRHHDQINTTLAGATVTITGQNNVKVYIKSVLEFNGKVSSINPIYNVGDEAIQVTAQMEQQADNRQTVNIPLPGLTENRTLYQIVTCSPTINNPYMDTRLIIVNQSNKYWTGSVWSITKSSAITFANYSAAESYYNAVDEDDEIFWDSTPKINNYEESPEYYNGIIADLGDKIEQNVTRYTSFFSVADDFIDGTLELKQNWSYFFFARLENFITGQEMATNRYIGTSPSGITNDTWHIHYLSHKKQREYEDTITSLGTYAIGTAPFQELSVSNGKLITKDKWVDDIDGLYRHRDASYDYVDYIKNLAALEYQKITNINGQVSPITGASINLTIDAYYFYSLKLLTRINITNTLTANMFTSANGFPVAIKSITLSAGNNPQVSLNCDNQKSRVELLEIEAQEPNIEDFQEEEEHVLNYTKFDVSSFKKVE